MISYSQYKIKEANEPSGGPATAAAAPPASNPSPAGLPSPATGMPPDLGMSSDPSSNMTGGGLDSLMGGGPSPGPAGGPVKSLNLKYSNVWEAFEKLLKSIKV